jgi:PGAP1-like protein
MHHETGPPGPETSVVDLGPAAAEEARQPGGLADLVAALFATTRAVTVERVGVSAYVVHLPGPHGVSGVSLRAVGAAQMTYSERAIRAIESMVRGNRDAPARALLVAHGEGGAVALDVAAMAESDLFDVDRIVTVGAAGAFVPRVPAQARMLCLEERTDLGALLGSVVNAGAGNRLTVVFDGTGTATPAERYVAGARLADASDHPDLVRAIEDLRELGYLG